jgi:hypothetical protein
VEIPPDLVRRHLRILASLGLPVTYGIGRYQTKLGDEHYLWILVILEVVAIGWLRHAFRRRHGG